MKNFSPATTIGCKAHQILNQSPHLIVRGIHSRGIFLASDTDWIVFLSKEHYRGPLTINIDESFSSKGITINSHVQFKGNMLSFNNVSPDIDINDTEMYCTPRIAITKTLAKNPFPEFSIQNNHPLNEKITRVQKALQLQDWVMVKEACDSMFGYGTGLTPEGDDFVLGLLYSLGQMPIAEQSIIKTTLNDLVHAAYLKTTTLSANLIECGVHGQVDERIHAALQAIIQQDPDQGTAIQNLLRWGNTSGKMVLAGMISGFAVIN